MKEKKNSSTEWIIFSVLSVILPVIFAFIISSIVNGKIVGLSKMIDSIIIVTFSIACSLLSICWNVHKQRSGRLTTVCFWVAGIIMFLSWTVYIFSLTKNKIFLKQICIICLIIVVICSILGIILGKRIDKNENETIYSMHCNCNYIRETLIKKENNDLLKSHVLRDYDLLCHPSEFDRVNEVLKNIKCEVTDVDK